MPDKLFFLSNQQARSVWLHCHHLLQSPLPAREHHRLSETIESLGMVQLDPIAVLARAHDHILWSRHSSYRNPDFYGLYSDEPCVFEHFTHDAALLPVSLWPVWQEAMLRRSQRFARSVWGSSMACAETRAGILKAIEKKGPMCSQEFTSERQEKANKTLHSWMKPPSKLALDYLWLAGTLSVSHRSGFRKYYDLSERVIPQRLRNLQINKQQQLDGLCEAALSRLGIASAREIQQFYDVCSMPEIQAWLRKQTTVQTINVEAADGRVSQAYAFDSLEALIASLPEPGQRIRILNPFDPAIRDRKRLKRLFGFDYRIEMYVPAARRRYGYYVCPILEGVRVIGRIDVRADREKDRLATRAWWLEPGVKPSRGRTERLLAELGRLAKLAGVAEVGALPPATRIGGAG